MSENFSKDNSRTKSQKKGSLDSSIQNLRNSSGGTNFEVDDDVLQRIKREFELKEEFLRRPHHYPVMLHPTKRPSTLSLKTVDEDFDREFPGPKSISQPLGGDSPTDKSKKRRTGSGREKDQEETGAIRKIKQSKSEPIVQRHLMADNQSSDEARRRKSFARKDIDKIADKLREKSAPRSSIDESSSSRKSSISSSRKKMAGKEFAVTLFVNEADKNKILDMLQRAKNVISKKVEKVMGKKTTKISNADALKTVLQNWVEEEEVKTVEEKKEIQGLIEEQTKQVDQMVELGLKPPVEMPPGTQAVEELSEAADDEQELPDEVFETDLEVQELTDGRQHFLSPPERRFHLSRSSTPPNVPIINRQLQPCENVPRHFCKPDSEIYPPKLRRPSSMYDANAQAASSRPVSRQGSQFSSHQQLDSPAKIIEEEPCQLPVRVVRPISMTIPIGGVWRPGDSDHEEESFLGTEKSHEKKTASQETPEHKILQTAESEEEIKPSGSEEEEVSAYRDTPDVVPRLKRKNLAPDTGDDRNLRRVSYIRATKDDVMRVDTEVEDTTKAEESSQSQLHKILSVFGIKSDVSQASPSGDVTNKLDEFQQVQDALKQGWVHLRIELGDVKKNEDFQWKRVYLVLKNSSILIYKDKKYAFQTPSTNDYIPLPLTEISAESTDMRRKTFQLSTDRGDSYIFQTENEQEIRDWMFYIQGAKSSPVKPSQYRNRSPSVLSPNLKIRKGSTDPPQTSSDKKSWKGKVAKQWKKIQGATTSYPEGGSIGVPLEECPVARSTGCERVPLLVQLCCGIVEERGLDIVGIYRVPGNSVAVSHLTDQVNRGEDQIRISDPKWNDVNVVSSLLKSFFRKLPDPIFTLDMYSLFIEVSKIDDCGQRLTALKSLVRHLPEQNYETLKFVCAHLRRVIEHSDVNKMDLRNLSIVFGPTLVRASDDNMMSMVTDMAHQCRIIETILSNFDWFFNEDVEIPLHFASRYIGGISSASSVASDITHAGAQSLLISNIPKLEDCRKSAQKDGGNVRAKDIMSGIISAANRKMLRATAIPTKSKKDSSLEVLSSKFDPSDRRNSESVLQDTFSIAAAVPKLMNQVVCAHSASVSNISTTSSKSSQEQTMSTLVTESTRSSRDFMARSWNNQDFDARKASRCSQESCQNLEEDSNVSYPKFPIDTYHGLDEATARRIKQFEEETRAMMAKNVREMKKVLDNMTGEKNSDTEQGAKSGMKNFDKMK